MLARLAVRLFLPSLLITTAASCARRSPAGLERERFTVEVSTAPHRPGVFAVTATAEARDVTAAGGAIFVVATGALLEHIGGRPARTLTWATGLGASELVAACALGDEIAVAGADGSITLVGNTTTIARWGAGTITELASDGERLFVATPTGLHVWMPGAAQATRILGRADVTALASGPRGLAIGSAAGEVWILASDGTLQPVPTAVSVSDGVTALAWDGDALWIGRPSGLDRWVGDAAAVSVRRDFGVTALLADGSSLLVGTHDGGVLALDPGGLERRLLGGAHVARLRRVGVSIAAVADGAVYALPEGALMVPAPSPSLSANAVSALVATPDAIWVGTNLGVDVLTPTGGFVRHLVGRQPVYDLAARPDSNEIVIGTAQGAVIVSEQSEHRVGPHHGLLGSRLQTSTSLADRAAYGTDQGVTIIDGIGSARRLTSGAELPAGGVTMLAWGAGGRLYVGSPNGLAIVTDATTERTLPIGAVAGLALGADGMYAISANGLDLVLPSGQLEHLGAPPVDGDWVRGALALEMMPSGERLYIGSTTRGLLVYERAQKMWHVIRGPLPSGNVTAVALTRDAVWLGTDNGVVRLARTIIDSALGPPARS